MYDGIFKSCLGNCTNLHFIDVIYPLSPPPPHPRPHRYIFVILLHFRLDPILDYESHSFQYECLMETLEVGYRIEDNIFSVRSMLCLINYILVV